MHYRLAYAEPLRRQSYRESRWAAPPAELLESVLKRRHAAAEANGPGCRLHLVLDEFEQRFDAP
jgi:cholesterol transport system auxiliary component